MKEDIIEFFIGFYIEVLRPTLFSVFLSASFLFCYLYFFAGYTPECSLVHVIAGLTCGILGTSSAICINERIKSRNDH